MSPTIDAGTGGDAIKGQATIMDKIKHYRWTQREPMEQIRVQSSDTNNWHKAAGKHNQHSDQQALKTSQDIKKTCSTNTSSIAQGPKNITNTRV